MLPIGRSRNIGKLEHATKVLAVCLPPVVMSLIGLAALSRKKSRAVVVAADQELHTSQASAVYCLYRAGKAAPACSVQRATNWRRMKLRPAASTLPFQPGKTVGNIFYGACSWTDRTLIESGTYPETAKTAADPLSSYASAFPIVEVDATYYALPSATSRGPTTFRVRK